MTWDTALSDNVSNNRITVRKKMTERLRVLLLIPHLGGGGAEQVTALLARGLSREKYELHLGLMTQAEGAGAAFPGVTVHGLSAARVRAGADGLLRLVWRLRPRVDLVEHGPPQLSSSSAAAALSRAGRVFWFGRTKRCRRLWPLAAGRS